MREYKFRGRRVDNGEWVKGYYYAFVSSGKTIASIDDGAAYMVDPETVGQYIGHKDDSETEVCQGDRVMALLTGDIYEVIWDDIGCGYLFAPVGGDGTSAIDYYEFEDICSALGFRVVGNVHDDKGVSGND